jgi:DNA repair protein RadC
MPKIKDLPKTARPREKLARTNPSNLKDEELLAILLSTGYRGKSAIELAKYLLKKYTLPELLTLNYKDLVNLKGLGPAKAATLKAAFELCQRGLKISSPTKITIDNAKDTFAQVAALRDKKQEHLIALFLNARNELLAKETIAVGTLTANLISPREIFTRALDHLAASVVLAHNHPSGDPKPSEEDIRITEKLIAAGKVMDVTLFDHLIVSTDGYFSMRQKMPILFD